MGALDQAGNPSDLGNFHMNEPTIVTLRLSQEVLAVVRQHGYAAQRPLDDFLSQLLLDYHQRQLQQAEQRTSIEEHQQVVDLIEQLLCSETDLSV